MSAELAALVTRALALPDLGEKERAAGQAFLAQTRRALQLQVAVNERGQAIGEDHPRAKLTDAQVEQIHALRDTGLSYRKLAARFGVSPSTVSDIVNGWIRGQAPDGYRSRVKRTGDCSGEHAVLIGVSCGGGADSRS